MKEYMVKVWGGAFSKEADPSIEKDLNIKEGTYYFSDEDKKNSFLRMVKDPKYRLQGLMIKEKYGEMTHKQTIMILNFKYKEKQFTVDYNFGYEYEEEDAIYMFTEGNYSCDCNRSLFIRNQYGKDSIPQLDCGGDEIELLDYHFVYID